jgi:hypothetical protein
MQKRATRKAPQKAGCVMRRMTVGLLSKSLASVVAVGLMAAWMMPPTQPKPVAPSPLAGLPHLKPMELPPAASIPPAVLTPPELASETSPLQAGSEGWQAQPAVIVVRGNETPAPQAQRTSDEVPPPNATEPIELSDRGQSPAPDYTRYRNGLNWARSHEVEEAQDCPSSPDDPAQQGCLDYARQQESSSEGAPD